MSKWVVKRLIDLLIVFILVSIALWYGVKHYPQFFPQRIQHYWGFLVPQTSTSATIAVSQVQP